MGVGRVLLVPRVAIAANHADYLQWHYCFFAAHSQKNTFLVSHNGSFLYPCQRASVKMGLGKLCSANSPPHTSRQPRNKTRCSTLHLRNLCRCKCSSTAFGNPDSICHLQQVPSDRNINNQSGSRNHSKHGKEKERQHLPRQRRLI